MWANLATENVAYSLLALSYAAEGFMEIYVLYCFKGNIPGLCLTVLRIRDAIKAWQWIYIKLIPIVGAILFKLFCVNLL